MNNPSSKRADVVEIQDRLMKSLPVWYPGVTDSNASLVFVQRKEYRWSWHLLFRIVGSCKHEGQQILVKCPKAQDSVGRVQRGVRSEQDSQLLEYRALSLLYEHFGSGQLDGVTAVRPLAYFPGTDALALEYLPGQNLLLVMLAGVRPWARQSALQAAVDAATRAGRLAGGLHQMRREQYPRTESFDSEAYYINLQKKVDELMHLSIGTLVHRRLDGILRMVRQFASTVQENVVVTYLHNDLQLSNFIELPDGRVCMIDTTLEWTGPVEKDISRVLILVETPKQRVLGGAGVVRADALGAITQAFLSGYCERSHYSSRVLILYRLLVFVQRWSALLDILRRKAPALVTSVIQRIRVNPFMLGYLDSISKDIQEKL